MNFGTNTLEYIWWCSRSHTMASAPPCPAWSLEGGHPLRPSLLFHLRLHPHCHLPPPCCVSCRWGDQAHPGQGAQTYNKHISMMQLSNKHISMMQLSNKLLRAFLIKMVCLSFQREGFQQRNITWETARVLLMVEMFSHRASHG